MSLETIIDDIMAQKSLLTLLFALALGILLVFSQKAEASKGPIITNKVCPSAPPFPLSLSRGSPSDLVC